MENQEGMDCQGSGTNATDRIRDFCDSYLNSYWKETSFWTVFILVKSTMMEEDKMVNVNEKQS